MNFSNSRRNLSSGSYVDKTLEGANMRATMASGSSWTKCVFRDVAFDSSTFNGATFTGCRFERCKMQNSAFNGARLTDCFFDDCDLLSTNFSNTRLVDVVFDSSKLEFSGWLDATLIRVNLLACNLSGAHLLFSYGKDVDYRGSNLHNCSVKLGCPFFRDATFDERQWSYMQSLIGQVKGVEKRQAAIMPLVDDRIRKAVEKMMFEEADEAEMEWFC